MKSKDPKIKNSLSKKLTIKIAILMAASFLVLLSGAFIVVDGIISREALNYNGSHAFTICDLVCHEAAVKKQPVSINDHDAIKLYSDYYCRWGRIEYITTYILRDNDTKITYLNCSVKEGSRYSKDAYDELLGREYTIVPSEKDRERWSVNDRAYYQFRPLLGGSAEAVAASYDGHGNKLIVEAGISFRELFKSTVDSFLVLVAILFAAFILIAVAIYNIIRKSVFLPAKQISDSMSEFIMNGQRQDIRLDESGNDEFAMISSSFNKMTENIDTYLENINRLTSVQEHQKAEIDIAAQIQMGLLAPGEFHSGNCEVYASMTPARNVGGDFYDYLLLDNGRILLTIADVSGKGIPAAMLMATTLVLMRQYAKMNCSPAEILRRVNDTLSEHNPNLMFVTAFTGIYDPKTQELAYSNAGHNTPYLLRDEPEPLDGAENMVLGLYGDESYTQKTKKINTGDIIFLYTDGVTEAVDEAHHFYSAERLEKTLDAFRPSHEENLVRFVDRSVHEFTGDTEQYDDLTMLSLTIKEQTVLKLKPEEPEFSKIRQVILDSQLPRDLQLSLCVAAEEIFINICSYAFEGLESPDTAEIRFGFEYFDRIRMRFEDNGMAYDPTDDVQYDMDYDVDTQIGGLGKLIAFTIADSVIYEYTDNKNILTITKYLKGGNK